METQNKQILKWLKAGKSITAKQALMMFGCMRLAARIYDLIGEGHDINKTMIKRAGKQVARYSLKGAK